ncbi:hypothetical protein CC77DRAFT_1037478 [Alternaria alternata]|uniref:Uncharacterized protein n=3 Tax=Alternaria sect. Alternaria TaxID=2499237 RepID=A0A177E060_ALTAL|nr:hypothetical protein CC77DRAFT_1037478 [Alternaria alternata]RYN30333.1 hypothetical protein AA0115_g4784 [Alternaria tenuissima]OAG25365.1 hypothetical protein CC77DRAFT_1037478 [Alternaria alternata]OWY44856.1 zinc finger fyve phd-type protein [Alternaria alternata]RYN85894.1 hypothetical protein AA0120_g8469 [Alternaria tenuissima]RYO20314.1 hypothetical protein AA0121_g3748 [Alternaria tenuissima]
MVVLVDLDDDEPTSLENPHPSSGRFNVKPLYHSLDAPTEGSVTAGYERPNPNINGFSQALSCYPIVSQLAAQLDLNTLHDLSRTCRQFRANLLEYRSQLVKHTLHCENEDGELGEKLESRLQEGRHGMVLENRLTTGRVGKCARDMVGDCQRCGDIVCRNCTMKPPPTPTLRARHRRLCRTCAKAPLPLLMAAQKQRTSSMSSSSPPGSPDTHPVLFDGDKPRAFTAPAFERTPCNCDNVVWLCAPCGKDLRNADTHYVRGWSYRTTYTRMLGGLGVGFGEGIEGVECGRGSACLGSRIVEHETCEQNLLDTIERSQTPESPERWRGSCYLTQEIEGIGGVLKVKHKKQVRVGECVKLYEDEKTKSIQYLEREVKGELRSWCSWCERVVRSKKDEAEVAGNRPTSSGSSSSSSSKRKSSY